MSADSPPALGPDLAAGIPAASLREEAPLVGHFGNDAVLLVRRGRELFGIGATCSHYGGPLAEGLIVGDTVRCPWHHACFSLRTGETLRAPALLSVGCYDVDASDGTIHVRGLRKSPGTVRPRARRPPVYASVAIVGAGAAGNSVAEELRRLGYEGQVTLFDPDADAPYDRPNLSKDYLAGNAPEEWIPLHPRSHYDELGLELVLGRPVARLETAVKRLTLEDGTTREFAAIVLATGAEPIRLTLPGSDGPPVHLLRSLRDSRAIIEATDGARHAVVLGASFIGLEVAASLRTRGVEVAIVAPESRPLERVLGPQVGDFIRVLHESHGVDFNLGTTASRLEKGHVVLANGTRRPADLVVAGVGVRPRTALAEQAGLRVDNGILVDTHLETSSPGIFAIGDAARYPDPLTGELVRIEHWVHAQRQGQAVARILAGDRRPFTDVPFFWSQHYDVVIAYVGHAAHWDAVDIDGSLEDHDARVRYLQQGNMRAVASIFRDRESLEAEVALEREIAEP